MTTTFRFDRESKVRTNCQHCDCVLDLPVDQVPICTECWESERGALQRRFRALEIECAEFRTLVDALRVERARESLMTSRVDHDGELTNRYMKAKAQTNQDLAIYLAKYYRTPHPACDEESTDAV